MSLNIILKYREFFKKITMVGASFLISSSILFLFHIYLGRFLGPHGYGSFTYVITVGNFLALLYTVGLQPAIINIISPKTGGDRKECLSTTFLLIIALFTAVSTVYFASQGIISSLFKLETHLVKYSILYAMAFSFFNLTQAFIQSLQDMKSVSVMRLLSSTMYIVIFFTAQYFAHDLLDFKTVVECKVFGLGVAFSVMIIFVLRKEITFRLFNLRSASVLFHYAVYGFLLQLSAAFILEFTKVILNKYFDAAMIGLFQVYTVSSVSIAQMMITSIVIVYFPTISKSNNKAGVIKTLTSYEKYLPFLFIPSYILSFLFFRMYGEQYQLNLGTLAIFNVYVVFLFISSIYSRTLESFGVYGIRSSFFVSFTGAIMTVVLSIIMIPSYGINGAILTMAITRLFFYVAFKVFLRGRVKEETAYKGNSA
jgi:O-antigen/teichoic acid export membrane protein